VVAEIDDRTALAICHSFINDNNSAAGDTVESVKACCYIMFVGVL